MSLKEVFARKLETGGPECMHDLSCYGCPRLGDDCDGNESIYDLEAGDTVYFGHYLRRTDAPVGLSVQPLEWKVVKTEGHKALLVAFDIGIIHRYAPKTLVWRDCELREWLNNEFMDLAFTEDEKAAILETPNSDGVLTPAMDKVFILSKEEYESLALFMAYETCHDWEKEKKASDANDRRVYTWWLRSTEPFSVDVATGTYVDMLDIRNGENGIKENVFVDNGRIGVVPAVWVEWYE